MHYIDILAMCCPVISTSYLFFCSFTCVIYVQSTLQVVVNFCGFFFYYNIIVTELVIEVCRLCPQAVCDTEMSLCDIERCTGSVSQLK